MSGHYEIQAGTVLDHNADHCGAMTDAGILSRSYPLVEVFHVGPDGRRLVASYSAELDVAA